MAAKKARKSRKAPSAAQIAWRKKFAAKVKAGAFKKSAKKRRALGRKSPAKKRNSTKTELYNVFHQPRSSDRQPRDITFMGQVDAHSQMEAKAIIEKQSGKPDKGYEYNAVVAGYPIPVKKRNTTIIRAKRIEHLDVSKIHSLGKVENPEPKRGQQVYTLASFKAMPGMTAIYVGKEGAKYLLSTGAKTVKASRKDFRLSFAEAAGNFLSKKKNPSNSTIDYLVRQILNGRDPLKLHEQLMRAGLTPKQADSLVNAALRKAGKDGRVKSGTRRRKPNITSASDLQYAGTAKKATQDGVEGWQLGSKFFPGSATTKAQKITSSAYLDLRTGDVWKRKAKGNPKKSLIGKIFHVKGDRTQFQVMREYKAAGFIPSVTGHSLDGKKQVNARVADIVLVKASRKKNIAGFMQDGVFHPIRSGVEQRTVKGKTRLVKSKKAYKPSKVGESRTYSAKKSAKRAAQSKRMTAATKQRKATTSRLASRSLDRSGPARKTKRRNPNADTKAAYESFQGKPSTKSTSLNFPNGTPANVYKLGTLHSITLQSGAVVKPAGKTVWLCADTKGKLHLGTSGERLVNAPKGALGKVKEVEYITTKPHLGDNRPTRYYHELGEETGQKPTLYSDGAGGLVFKGGATYVRSDGIHN